MRITDRQASDIEFAPADLNRVVFDDAELTCLRRINGDLGRYECRDAHGDFCGDHTFAFHCWPDGADAAACLDAQSISFRQRNFSVDDELGEEPYPVATHLGLRPVGVVDPHADLGRFRVLDQNDTVGTDAERQAAHFY